MSDDLEDVFPGTADAPLPDYCVTVIRPDGTVGRPLSTLVPAGEGHLQDWRRE